MQEYTYRLLKIEPNQLIVQYVPPDGLGLGVTQRVLPFHLDGDTTAQDITDRIEALVPIEDWELIMDVEQRQPADFSSMLNVVVTVEIADVAARSRRQREADQAAAATVAAEAARPASMPVVEV